MLASLLITFRESLEASLIIGIILAFLIKTKREKYNNIVYLGVVAAIIASIGTAFLFNALSIQFEGLAEQIFEGVAMLIAAGMLTYMIIWMKKQKGVTADIQHKVSAELDSGKKAGLFFLAFIAVFREGVETVLFLGAAKISGGGDNVFLGAFIGIVLAIILGYMLFVSSKHINLKKFFHVTSLLLILFAAGLTAHGVHEFQEAGSIPIIKEHVWDINPELNEDGSYPAMHEKGSVGSIFKGLFGYNGNPNLLEVMAYLLYLGVVLFFFYKE